MRSTGLSRARRSHRTSGIARYILPGHKAVQNLFYQVQPPQQKRMETSPLWLLSLHARWARAARNEVVIRQLRGLAPGKRHYALWLMSMNCSKRKVQVDSAEVWRLASREPKVLVARNVVILRILRSLWAVPLSFRDLVPQEL